MGVVENVSWNKYPNQDNIGRRVLIVFNYDLSHILHGTIIRDDIDTPYQTIIKLDDGRYILSTECQYQYEQETGWRSKIK